MNSLNHMARLYRNDCISYDVQVMGPDLEWILEYSIAVYRKLCSSMFYGLLHVISVQFRDKSRH